MIGPVLFQTLLQRPAATDSSTIRLLAADTIPLYRFITASEDHDTLQADLQKMEEWDMRFHPSGKCSVLTMSRKQTTSSHQYKLHNAK